MTILKSGGRSTLDIVERVKRGAPTHRRRRCRKRSRSRYVLDQSIFVRAALARRAPRGVIAACLTALMILLFLGSWRSTLIVAISIPLAILCRSSALRPWARRST